MKSEDVLLTNKEIMQLYTLLPNSVTPETAEDFMKRQGVFFAKAQLQKIIKWGQDDCPHLSDVILGWPIQEKHWCAKCWQELRETVIGY